MINKTYTKAELLQMLEEKCTIQKWSNRKFATIAGINYDRIKSWYRKERDSKISYDDSMRIINLCSQPALENSYIKESIEFKSDLMLLERAITHLRDYHAKAINAKNSNDGNFEAFRAATIQAFEYSYALCTKLLKRYLEISSDTNENMDELSFSDRLRIASERGIIRNQELWFTFREKRNITSHTYQEDKAEAVFSIMEDFEREAGNLLMQLKTRNI